MKPFNLDEALAGKPVATRDGKRVLKIGVIQVPEWFTGQGSFPVVACVEGMVHMPSFTTQGSYFCDRKSPHDLCMAEPEKKTLEGTAMVFSDGRPTVFVSGDDEISIQFAEGSSGSYSSYPATLTWEE